MKTSSAHRYTAACFGVCAALIALVLPVEPAHADQQLWSSQFIHWVPDGKIGDVWNVDQQVWIPRPNTASFWPMRWVFAGGGDGYLGLMQDRAGAQIVRFSIWNATATDSGNCQPFGNEGVGRSCTLSVRIDPRKFYRLRLWRLDSAADGQWWSGWLIESDGKGGLTEHLIGKIKAPKGKTAVDPGGIYNFGEYWGQRVANCQDVPLSIAVFAPPAVNFGGGRYEGRLSFGGTSKQGGNKCVTGSESQGALISVRALDLGYGHGAAMFLGGTESSHMLDAAAVPPALPADGSSPPLLAQTQALPAMGRPVAAGAPEISYIVSQRSPLLPQAEKTAISQDFNGAPLDNKPRVHRVVAKSVMCRARNNPSHTMPSCSLDFGRGLPVDVQGDDAATLFDALAKAGAQEDAGMGHVQRALANLNCSVDDTKVQDAPGDIMQGFACTFTIGQ